MSDTSESPQNQSDPWDEVKDLCASPSGRDEERARCLNIVRAEIQAGLARGIPATAAVMTILARIDGAIAFG